MSHWALTRDDTKEVLTLDGQYYWRDEHDWTPLAQSEPVYTLTGAMDIQQGTKKAGRPITLQGENVRISRELLNQLRDWTSVPELSLVLTHPKGDKYPVMFASTAIVNIHSFKPISPIDQDDTDKFMADICFLTA